MIRRKASVVTQKPAGTRIPSIRDSSPRCAPLPPTTATCVSSTSWRPITYCSIMRYLRGSRAPLPCTGRSHHQRPEVAGCGCGWSGQAAWAGALRAGPGILAVAGSGGLLVEEVERDRREQRRHAEVVVGQTGQDGQRVAAFRSSLAHPAAVAQAAVEQIEHFDVVARRG